MDNLYRKSMVLLGILFCLLLFPYLSKADVLERDKIEDEIEADTMYRHVTNRQIISSQREVEFELLERTYKYDFSEEDYDALLRIVEAEAGGEDYTGKLLVANVVLNRLRDDGFPDTIKDVIYQKINGRAQFSPVGSGRIDRVQVSEMTRQAVEAALYGEDISEGALYFAARRYADPDKMKWFDSKLIYLFAHGAHEFFTETVIAEN